MFASLARDVPTLRFVAKACATRGGFRPVQAFLDGQRCGNHIAIAGYGQEEDRCKPQETGINQRLLEPAVSAFPETLGGSRS